MSRTHAGGRATAARRASAVAVVAAFAGCVTTYEDAPLLGTTPAAPAWAVPVTIPIPTGAGGSPAAVAFHRGVLQRLEHAAKARDAAEIESLLASFDHPDLPAAMREHVRGYRAVALGLRFCEHAGNAAALVAIATAAPVEQGVPALGAPLPFELQLPAAAVPVRLGGAGDDDPVGFTVAITVDDHFVDGSTASASTRRFSWLPVAVELRDDVVLRLPIVAELPGANAVRRDVTVSVETMPGYVLVGDVRAPLPRTTLATTTATQWPVGYAAIAANPLQQLRAALRTFAPKDFARSYLAAAAVAGADRAIAIELLIEQVRFGRADQAQVAMAALRATGAADLAIGDREAWLAWWNASR